MPPVPGRVNETCAVTPSKRSCSVSRNPVFIASAITSVATPAATPITENSVTSRSTAGRYGDLRYRRATNHSNRIANRLLGLSGSCARSGPVTCPRRRRLPFALRPKQRKENDVPNRLRVGQQHRQPVYANSLSSRRRHAVRQCANVVDIQLLRNFVAALFDLCQE